MAYLLHCPDCSRTLPVELGMAGENARCACGATVAIPMLRVLRTYPQADSELAEPPLVTWRHAIIFLGFIIILFGLAFSFAFMEHRGKGKEQAEFVGAEYWTKNIDQLPPGELWKVWIHRLQDGIQGPSVMHPALRQSFEQNVRIVFGRQQEKQKLLMWEYFGYGIAALGALIALAAFFFPAQARIATAHNPAQKAQTGLKSKHQDVRK
jgi:hypothetical protein